MIGRALRKLAKIAWFLPGFLLWASFPPMGEAGDCLFALAPLLWVARRKSPRKAFRLWFANGLLFWIATLVWMPAIVKNGGPWPLVVLGWFGLAAYCALYFGAFGWLASRAWMWAAGEGDLDYPSAGRLYLRRLLVLLLVEPVLWAGLEWVRGNFLGGFAWNQLGAALAQTGFGAPASLGGVALLSALVLLVNGTFASIAERMWRPAPLDVPRTVRFVETLLPLLLVWGVYAATAKCRPWTDPDRRVPLSVGVVQRNFPCVFRAAEENPAKIYQELLASLRPFSCDLLVLPESALAEWGPVGGRGAQAFAAWALDKAGAQALVAGGERREDSALYNSAALYRRNPAQAGSVELSVYDKVHLVPFGEYIPGDKVWPFLQRFAPVGSCTPGTLRLLELKSDRGTFPFGVAICYEDTDAALVREQVRRGARFLVFITNDSWFSRSVEPVQHAWQSVVRALETGRPVVRTGNSGVSGFILPNGSAHWLADGDGTPLVDERGVQAERLFVDEEPVDTVYVRFGDGPLLVLFGGILLAMLATRLANGRKVRRALAKTIENNENIADNGLL